MLDSCTAEWLANICSSLSFLAVWLQLCAALAEASRIIPKIHPVQRWRGDIPVSTSVGTEIQWNSFLLLVTDENAADASRPRINTKMTNRSCWLSFYFCLHDSFLTCLLQWSLSPVWDTEVRWIWERRWDSPGEKEHEQYWMAKSLFNVQDERVEIVGWRARSKQTDLVCQFHSIFSIHFNYAVASCYYSMHIWKH